jgi:hypothetical protein
MFDQVGYRGKGKYITIEELAGIFNKLCAEGKAKYTVALGNSKEGICFGMKTLIINENFSTATFDEIYHDYYSPDLEVEKTIVISH